ncbi:MAG TPA: M56 family metallopeptidase, partial [Chitinophagaceae bacterium]|nr:M56 family metallopeptidase [Chitinophagaceae bacterium]
MLQYFLNCSAIWLLSLLCYDVFLKRNTFHSYNRIYLLATLIAGILIPLLNFESRQVYQQQVATSTVVEQTIEAKKDIVIAAQAVPAAQNIDWMFWLGILYGTGCVISLIIVFRELATISLLYARSIKEKIGNNRIVLTGKNHSPFSFCGRIFLSDKERYNEAQLKMILTHEQRHLALWHGADVLLLSLCTILFWFHPLPYLYRQRLLILHEYQADSMVDSPLPEYG